MPANTTRAALPYPLGTDPVSDGDDAIKNLANRLDGSVGNLASVPYAMATGQSNIVITAATSGTVAITFPASRFTIAPIVMMQGQNNYAATAYAFRTSANPTTGGFTAVVNLSASGSVTVGVGWLAVQMINSGSGYG